MRIIEKALLEMDNTDDIKESTLLTETLEDFLNNGMTVSESLALNEATLSSKERKSLPDKTFGLPEKRKFPLNDYDHVILAIKFFNRCDKKDQEELAKNILKAMRKYKVPTDKIGKNNKLRNYINEFITEGLFKKDPYKDAIKKYKNYNPSRPNCTKTINDIENTLVDDIAKNIRTKLIKVENNEDDTLSVIFKTDKVSGLNKRCFDAVIRSKGVTLLNESYKLITVKYKDCILLVSTSDEDDDDIESIFRIDLSVLYCKEYSDACKISISSIEVLCKNVNITYTSLVNPAFASFSVAGGGNAYTDKYPNIEKNTGCKIIPKAFVIYVFSNNAIHESVGVPVVGLTSKTPVIVDNMYNNAFTSLEMDEEIIRNCMMSSTKALLNKEDKFYVPYIPYIQESLNIDPNIGFYRDRNGIFVMNENTKLRSPSYNDVDDIDDRTILYVTYGELNDSKLNDL